jgi:thioredoxin reductase (NADPH)
MSYIRCFAPGGQLSELYPKKPIHDIPGFPEVLAEI